MSEEDYDHLWKPLLDEVKVIRDPVHGDIWITEIETAIIDTEAFQRLRYIRQLGPAFLVYPGAQHTRFDHALGTLKMAKTLIDAINKNYERGVSERLTNKEIFITRIVALLHDLVHLPFGHTLEDEGRLFKKKQWEDEERHYLFDEVTKVLKDKLTEKLSGKIPNAEKEIREVLEDIRKILIAEEKEVRDTKEMKYPHIADIVGNTVCADLLDYIKRDLYFTGLAGAYDSRIIPYFTIQKLKENGKEKKRVVILLYKEKRNDIRFDVLSGLLNLLRLRYSLAERVYYHHTKREASAMIIEMVAAALKAGIIDKRKLCTLGDDSLIAFIRDYNQDVPSGCEEYLKIAKKLAEKISKRELYKPVYEPPVITSDIELHIDPLKDDWEERFLFERELENLLDLEPGDIIVYIPHKDMGAKRHVKVLVKISPRDNPRPLDQIGSATRLPADYKGIDEIIKKELELLLQKHKSLWKMSVYVRDGIEEEKRSLIKGICEQWFEGKEPVSLVEACARKYKKPLNKIKLTTIADTVLQKIESYPPTSQQRYSLGEAIKMICDLLETRNK